jgi:hypothetical protein
MSSPAGADEGRDEVARYVLGEMTLDEQIAFEVRMTEDDELARAVTAAMTIDDYLYQAASPAEPLERRRGGSRWRSTRLAAVAAMAVLALGSLAWAWLSRRSAAAEIQLAVVSSPLRYQQLVAQVGLSASAAPAEAMRGEEAPSADGPSRVDALLRLLREQDQQAIAAPAAEVRGEAFVVPLRTDRELWVAVVGVFADGTGKLWFPEATDFDNARSGGQLGPGQHVLPTPRVAASAAQRERGVVAYSPGFVLPLGRDRVSVLVFALPSPPDAAAWQRASERLAQPAGDLRRDLTEIFGAACHEFVVRTN